MIGLWVGLGIIFLVIAIGSVIYVLEKHFDKFGLAMTLLIVFSVISIICFVKAANIDEDRNKSACESIGGHYEVVGKETTLMLAGKVFVPREVNIYGCVK